MSVSNELVGECPICGINVYNRGELNKPFTYLGKTRLGYPSSIAMPCGIDKSIPPDPKDQPGVAAYKELSDSQKIRCPFETLQEQELVEYKKGVGIFSGSNNWENS